MDLLTINDQPGQYPSTFYADQARKLDPFATPQGAMRCDVCVIGGGFTGLSSALHLAQAGFDVVLLEAQRVGFGASGRNGGQVGQGQRAEQDTLEAMVGLDHACKLWDIARQSVDLVRDLARSDLVAATFHDGIIHADHRKRYVSESAAYVDHLRETYHYHGVRALDREELREMVNSPAYFGGMIYEDAGHIDPFQFALGLARMACILIDHTAKICRRIDHLA